MEMVTVPPSGLRSKDLPSVRLKASAQRQPTAVWLYCFPYQDCFLTLEKHFAYKSALLRTRRFWKPYSLRGEDACFAPEVGKYI